jgi:hypothetical protein
VRCVIQLILACRRPGGVWAAKTVKDVADMCELAVDILRDVSIGHSRLAREKRQQL